MFILFNHVSFLLKRCLQVSQFCIFSNVVRICYCALFNCVMPPYVCVMVQNVNKTLFSISFFIIVIYSLLFVYIFLFQGSDV